MTKAEIALEVEKISRLLEMDELSAATGALTELCKVELFTRFKEIVEIQHSLARIAGRKEYLWIRGIGTMDKYAVYEHTKHWTYLILMHLSDVASDAQGVPTFPTPQELEESKNPPHNWLII